MNGEKGRPTTSSPSSKSPPSPAITPAPALPSSPGQTAFRAVDDVSFSLAPGRSVALVGRSGCGKSTLARLVLALDKATSGTIRFMGEDITSRSEAELEAGAAPTCRWCSRTPTAPSTRATRSNASSPSRCRCWSHAPDALKRRELVAHALHQVGLKPHDMQKYPHEFSWRPAPAPVDRPRHHYEAETGGGR